MSQESQRIFIQSFLQANEILDPAGQEFGCLVSLRANGSKALRPNLRTFREHLKNLLQRQCGRTKLVGMTRWHMFIWSEVVRHRTPASTCQLFMQVVQSLSHIQTDEIRQDLKVYGGVGNATKSRPSYAGYAASASEKVLVLRSCKHATYLDTLQWEPCTECRSYI